MVTPVLPPRAVIFDVDGTLLDSNDAHAHAWVDVLSERGYPVSFRRVRPLIGMGGDKLLPELTRVGADGPVGEEISRQRRERFLGHYLSHVQPFPGVRSLIERIRADGIKVAVATSANEDELGALLRRAAIEDLIEHSTSKADAASSKPDPDIVHAALARTGEASERVLMLGDTPYDIEAAARAGVATIVFRAGGGWSEQDLAGAVAIYDSPEELLRLYDQSPLTGHLSLNE
jgi:HAD superfamily hydrolase (TIGR01509 family)